MLPTKLSILSLSLLLVFATLGGGARVADAKAQTTASDVFQVAEQMGELLEELHRCNLSTPKLSRLPVTAKRPRHVYFKVRQVFLRVQELRALNGLRPHKLAGLSAGTIRPQQVYQLLSSALRDLRDLEPVFGIDFAAPAAKPSTNKTSTNVYAQLQRVSSLIEQLGIVEVLPNQVFAEADALFGDIRAIAVHQGLRQFPKAPPPSSSVSPADVYNAAITLMTRLSAVCKSLGDACPEGGIETPKHTAGAVVPAQVLELLLVARADAHAVRVALTGDAEMQEYKVSAGKTPADVAQSLLHSGAVLRALEKAGTP